MAASTYTIDPRPSVFGDRMIVTGSYTAGDTGTLAIDLSSMMSSIDWAGATSTGAVTPSVITDTGGGGNVQLVNFPPQVLIAASTLNVAHGLTAYPAQAGTFIAIGRRS